MAFAIAIPVAIAIIISLYIAIAIAITFAQVGAVAGGVECGEPVPAIYSSVPHAMCWIDWVGRRH